MRDEPWDWDNFPPSEDSPPLWDDEDEIRVPFRMKGPRIPYARPLRPDGDLFADDDEPLSEEHKKRVLQARRLLGMTALCVLATIPDQRLQRKAKRILKALRTMPGREVLKAWNRIQKDQPRLVAAMASWRKQRHNSLRMASMIEACSRCAVGADGKPGPLAREACQSIASMKPGQLDDYWISAALDEE